MLRGRWLRLRRWEFWSPWVFYPPIVLYVFWLGLRHRSLALFVLANPGIEEGGFVGESKSKILEAMGKDSPEIVRWTLISDSDPAAADAFYRKALLRFERLVNEGGVRNGRLFYNIGNINFLLKDIGRAILNYRRAELYMPGDPNVRRNLEFLQGKASERRGARNET